MSDLQSVVFDVLHANNTGTEFAHRVAREVKEAFLDIVRSDAVVKCDVVFLKNDLGVYAVFPDQVCSTTTPNEVGAYDDVGGHFGVLTDACYVDEEVTDPDEYGDLYSHMSSIGYELNVVSKESLINGEYQARRYNSFKMIGE